MSQKRWGVWQDSVEVETEFDQIKAFVKFAWKWQVDFFTPELRHFLNQDLQKTFDFVVSKYTLEDGEQILRPLYFAQIGSDCDDGLIFWLSLMMASHYPLKDLMIVEVKESPKDDYYCHVFAALRLGKKIIYLDNLPGSRFGVVDYEDDQMRMRPASRFL